VSANSNESPSEALRVRIACFGHIVFAFSLLMIGLHFGGMLFFNLTFSVFSLLQVCLFFLSYFFWLHGLPRKIQEILCSHPWSIPLVQFAVSISPLFFWLSPDLLLGVFLLLGILGFLKSISLIQPYVGWTLSIGVFTISIVIGVLVQLQVNSEMMIYGILENNQLVAKIGLHSPIFAEPAALTGLLHRDLYFHTSIMQMIQGYMKFSSGLDGFVTGFHHYLGHLFFTSWTRFLNLSPISATAVMQGIILIPVTLFQLALVMICCARSFLRIRSSIFLVIVMALMLIFFELGSLFTSVTFSFANIAGLAVLPWFFLSAEKNNHTLLNLGTLLLTCVVIFSMKMHTGVVWIVLLFGIVSLAYIKSWLFHSAVLVGLPGAVFLGIKIISGKYPPFGDSYLWHFPQYFFLFIPSLLFGFYFVYLFVGKNQRLGPVSKLHHILLSLVSALFILHLVSGSADMLWFSATTYFIHLVTVGLLVCEGKVLPNWQSGRTSLYSGLAVSVLLLLIAEPTLNSYQKFNAIAAKFDAVSVNDSPIFQTKKYIESLRLHQPDSATFLPPENPLWNYGEIHNHRSFYLPSILGMPLLFGLPPIHNDKCAPWCDLSTFGYGFDAYGENARSRNGISDTELCEHAVTKGFLRVLILRSTNMHRILDCRN